MGAGAEPDLPPPARARHGEGGEPPYQRFQARCPDSTSPVTSMAANPPSSRSASKSCAPSGPPPGSDASQRPQNRLQAVTRAPLVSVKLPLRDSFVLAFAVSQTVVAAGGQLGEVVRWDRDAVLAGYCDRGCVWLRPGRGAGTRPRGRVSRRGPRSGWRASAAPRRAWPSACRAGRLRESGEGAALRRRGVTATPASCSSLVMRCPVDAGDRADLVSGQHLAGIQVGGPFG